MPNNTPAIRFTSPPYGQTYEEYMRWLDGQPTPPVEEEEYPENPQEWANVEAQQYVPYTTSTAQDYVPFPTTWRDLPTIIPEVYSPSGDIRYWCPWCQAQYIGVINTPPGQRVRRRAITQRRHLEEYHIWPQREEEAELERRRNRPPNHNPNRPIPWGQDVRSHDVNTYGYVRH
jgi:hypothetical protein